MSGRPEQLFRDLQTPSAILNLMGQTEDAHFDCKEWPTKDEGAQKVFAKAACGLTNAEGGVVVVGMRARAVSKDDPDVVESTAPVANTSAVKSRILDLVGQLVEPGIEGVQAVEVNDPPDSKSGFVVVYIPASEGFPRRSRKDWKFYLRIGSGTFPMEYFQIADMFGRGAKPNLNLHLQYRNSGIVSLMGPGKGFFHQFWWLGLKNEGRGIAKFPSVRFKYEDHYHVYQGGIDGAGSNGLPRRPSVEDWTVFRGGVDDVVYPGTTLMVATLQRQFNHVDQTTDRWVFHPFTFSAEISCEGMPIKTATQKIPEKWEDR
jgi:hypothetical protein